MRGCPRTRTQKRRTQKGELKNGVGYCIVHNPLLLQPLRHWFTFIFRKYEHLAVEDFVIKDLHDSRGSRLRLLPCFPHLWWLEWDLNPHSPLAQQSSYQLNDPTISFVPLLYHNLGDLSRGIFEKSQPFSKNLFPTSPPQLRCVRFWWSCIPKDSRSTCRVVFPLDIIIITHPHPKVKNFFQKKFSQHPLTRRPGKSPPVVDIARY